MHNSKKEDPYSACFTSKETKPYLYGISGPGDGLGYYAWHGYPQNTFETREEAEKVARLMNLAFSEGEKKRSKDLKDLLMI